MAKKRLEIINYLNDFTRLSQGKRRRNSCYAFMPKDGPLDVSIIRRNPTTAFWAFSDKVGDVEKAVETVKSGEQLLVEVHLYVAPMGEDLRNTSRPGLRRPSRRIPATTSFQDSEPIPDPEEPPHKPVDI